MARSQQTFSKKEREQKRVKKRKEKAEKKEDRKAHAKEGTLANMMAYIDDDGNLTDTQPDPNRKKKKIDASTIEIGVPKREEVIEEVEREGKVTFFNDSKGYGFIKDLKSQNDVFVHINGTLEEIREGDKVVFEVEQGLKGPSAVRVKKYVAKPKPAPEPVPETPKAEGTNEDGAAKSDEADAAPAKPAE